MSFKPRPAPSPRMGVPGPPPDRVSRRSPATTSCMKRATHVFDLSVRRHDLAASEATRDEEDAPQHIFWSLLRSQTSACRRRWSEGERSKKTHPSRLHPGIAQGGSRATFHTLGARVIVP